MVAIALAVALPAFAKDKTPPVMGGITAINTIAKTVTIKSDDGTEKVIKTDDSTKISVGKNKTATLTDLVVGAEVKVVLNGDVATSIKTIKKK